MVLHRHDGSLQPEFSLRLLSLAHLTLMVADPIALIDAAVSAEFSHIGMRIVPPTPDAPMRPVIGDAPYQRAIRQRLTDSGLGVLDIEAFWLTAETDIAGIAPAFAFGAELGATYVVVVGNDPVIAPDRQSRAPDRARSRIWPQDLPPSLFPTARSRRSGRPGGHRARVGAGQCGPAGRCAAFEPFRWYHP